MPGSASALLGHGQSMIRVDSDCDLIVVLRWLAPADDRDNRENFHRRDRFRRRLFAGT